ncbi:hypothetical protein Ocin01_06573 [Orchesella cincta]|uniref:Uncharacterized protein n=1 Tax=Orchesella cincta TaxID=48709 RepID=A0A1D2N4C1_ORCCI|nr:hypothetical protein Ocin01_06573 [Orchesella cincta]
MGSFGSFNGTGAGHIMVWFRNCSGYMFWQKCDLCVFTSTGTKCFITPFPTIDDDYQNILGGRPSSELSTTTPYPTSTQAKSISDARLNWWVVNVLLPTAMFLIAVCFVLGVILIIKSYMMTSLKQNLAMAIRRRRRTGHAPDNQYIAPAEMRASMSRPCSDRKSFPPPEVLLAARERASQLYGVNHV